MGYIDTNARTTKSTAGEKSQPLGRVNQLLGVYLGFVKKVDDIQRMGRLQVWIPELGSPPDDESGWVTVSYCSPFAGATNVDTISKGDLKSFEGTQTSYGMWMVPPDINNEVLIMFINGDSSKGVWIGSLYNQFMNNMVPGMPVDSNNHQYPGKNVPVAEYNKWDKRITRPDQATKPVEMTKFKGLGNQGLITDPVRGTTSSGARRESPSQVFGILTPGPAIDSEVPYNKIRRKGGHALIMDDKEDSEYIQLTTKSGAQVRISETDGLVYLINRDGTAWVQMDYRGNIDIFGAGDISMRAQRDFNVRADRNINLEAGQNIFMKAAKDTREGSTAFTYDVNNNPDLQIIPVWKLVGEGNGDGGDIVMQALNDWQSTTKNNAYLTVEKQNMSIVVQNSYNLTTINGGQDYQSKLGIKLATEASYDLSTTGDVRIGSNAKVNVTGTGGIVLCTPATLSLNGDAGIIQNSAGSIGISSSTTVGIVGAISVGIGSGTGGASISGSLAVGGTLTANGGSTLKGQVLLGGATSAPGTPPVVPPSPTPQGPQSPGSATKAQIKPLNEKLNILATWADQDSKFKRDSQSVQVTVSRLPTYEPCPEHDGWSSSTVSGFQPIITPDDSTYRGSGTAGNEQTSVPEASVNPGANNSSVMGDPPGTNTVSKDIPQGALKCQLIRHEGRKNVSYKDSLGLLTGGIGHLLRQNETGQFPEGSPINDEQIEKWYNEDSISATKIAQKLMGDGWGDLSEIRKRALIDLSYNLGESRLSKFVSFLSALKQKDYQAAGQELRNSKWYGQVKSRGPAIVTMVVSNTDPTGCSK
jgi:lysozyme